MKKSSSIWIFLKKIIKQSYNRYQKQKKPRLSWLLLFLSSFPMWLSCLIDKPFFIPVVWQEKIRLCLYYLLPQHILAICSTWLLWDFHKIQIFFANSSKFISYGDGNLESWMTVFYLKARKAYYLSFKFRFVFLRIV